jgi:MarR family transcriptional regulator for hemolysin
MKSGRNEQAGSRRTLGFLLRESSRLMRRRFLHHAREAGLPLNLSEASLLSQVWHEPGINQAGIANTLDLETISVVRLVDGLEHSGLLQRRPHPRDRRVWTLWLTDAGMDAAKAVRQITDRVRREAFAGVTSSEREHLLDTLVTLRANLLQADQSVVA